MSQMDWARRLFRKPCSPPSHDSCQNCGNDRLMQDDNQLVCTECGTVSEQPIFTWSYSQSTCPFAQRAVYNRTKRFVEFIRSLGRHQFRGRLGDILDLYNRIEFYFGLHVKGHERKYFYSRKVVLHYIAQRLEIDVDLPLLKDPQRNKAQLKSIIGLRKHVLTGASI